VFIRFRLFALICADSTLGRSRGRLRLNPRFEPCRPRRRRRRLRRASLEAGHGGGRAGLDGANLLQRSILIVRALEEERGDTPTADRILDVPGLEAGIEPGVVPAAE